MKNLETDSPRLIFLRTFLLYVQMPLCAIHYFVWTYSFWLGTKKEDLYSKKRMIIKSMFGIALSGASLGIFIYSRYYVSSEQEAGRKQFKNRKEFIEDMFIFNLTIQLYILISYTVVGSSGLLYMKAIARGTVSSSI